MLGAVLSSDGGQNLCSPVPKGGTEIFPSSKGGTRIYFIYAKRGDQKKLVTSHHKLITPLSRLKMIAPLVLSPCYIIPCFPALLHVSYDYDFFCSPGNHSTECRLLHLPHSLVDEAHLQTFLCDPLQTS